MMKTLIAILLAITGMYAHVLAQEIRIGAKCNLSVMTLSGDNYAWQSSNNNIYSLDRFLPERGTFGYSAGISAILSLTHSLAVRQDVLYSTRKVQLSRPVLEAGDTTAIEDIKISMRYIDIPFLLSFSLPVDDDVSAVVAVGPQVSIRFGSSAVSATTIDLYSGKTEPLAVGNFNTPVFDIGMGIECGADFRIAEGTLRVAMFGVQGLKPISRGTAMEDGTGSGSLINRTIAFSIGYYCPL